MSFTPLPFFSIVRLEDIFRSLGFSFWATRESLCCFFTRFFSKDICTLDFFCAACYFSPSVLAKLQTGTFLLILGPHYFLVLVKIVAGSIFIIIFLFCSFLSFPLFYTTCLLKINSHLRKVIIPSALSCGCLKFLRFSFIAFVGFSIICMYLNYLFVRLV